jgi:hypothetical protein
LPGEFRPVYSVSGAAARTIATMPARVGFVTAAEMQAVQIARTERDLMLTSISFSLPFHSSKPEPGVGCWAILLTGFTMFSLLNRCQCKCTGFIRSRRGVGDAAV